MIDRFAHSNQTHRMAHTYRQAAELLGVSERTVFSWVKKGVLKAMKVGRTVRISTQELNDFIERQQSGQDRASSK